MRIPLSDVRACSECPKYFRFLKQGIQKPVSKRVSVALQVMQRGYVQANETGYKMTWRTIVEHVDSRIFTDVDVDNPDHFKSGRQASEYVLAFLRRWYYEYYVPEQLVGFADIPVEADLGSNTVYEIVPIVLLGEHPVIVTLDDVEQSDAQMYNNIKVRGLLWLVSKAIGCDKIEARHYAIGPQGGFHYGAIEISEHHKRVESAITQICSMISGGADFPSVTEKCKDCPFLRRCIL